MGSSLELQQSYVLLVGHKSEWEDVICNGLEQDFAPNIFTTSSARNPLMIEAVDSKKHLIWDSSTAFISLTHLLTALHAPLDSDAMLMER